MRKIIARSFAKYLSIILIVLSTSNINAQPNANDYPKPYMWSPDDPKMIENFKTHKLPNLNKYRRNIKQPESFTLINFFDMIEYFEKKYDREYQCLHVYIATYSRNNSRKVPKDEGKKLLLIFAPAKSPSENENTDLAYFHIPKGEKFDKDNLEKFMINDVQKKWREKKYVNRLMTSIVSTIDETDADNKIDGKVSETRCITFCRRDFQELLNEQGYKHTISDKPVNFSRNILASFAAFPETGNPRRANSGKNRLFVQFDFLDGENNPIYLEKTDGFLARIPKDKVREDHCLTCLPPKMLDNGHLCPPNTNCPND